MAAEGGSDAGGLDAGARFAGPSNAGGNDAGRHEPPRLGAFPAAGAPQPLPATTLVVLGALAAGGPFSMDFYTPGMPQMAADLHTTAALAQVTLTACLVGIAVGQLVLGALSDAIGRRGVLIAGTAGWALTSVVCATTNSIGVLIAARAAQGVFGAAGIVLSRAVAGDRERGPGLVRAMTVISIVISTAPVVAPVIGGLIVGWGGWRSVFWALAILGAAICIAVIVWVPESLPPERRRPARPHEVAHGLRLAWGRPGVRGAAIVIGAGSLPFFAYIAGATFVVQDVMGHSREEYVLMFGLAAAAALAVGWLTPRLHRRLTAWRTLRLASSVAALGGLIVLGQTVLGGGMVWLTVGAVVFVGSWGVLVPTLFTIGQAASAGIGGSGSALMGFVQFALGGLGSALPGLFGATELPFALTLSLGALVALVLAVVLLPEGVVAGRSAHGVR